MSMKQLEAGMTYFLLIDEDDDWRLIVIEVVLQYFDQLLALGLLTDHVDDLFNPLGRATRGANVDHSRTAKVLAC